MLEYNNTVVGRYEEKINEIKETFLIVHTLYNMNRNIYVGITVREYNVKIVRYADGTAILAMSGEVVKYIR